MEIKEEKFKPKETSYEKIPFSKGPPPTLQEKSLALIVKLFFLCFHFFAYCIDGNKCRIRKHFT